MKKLLILLLFLCSCATQKNIQSYSRIIDTTTILKDTVYITIPSYNYHSFTALPDTLKLETNIAKAYAYVDTTNKILVGGIQNKDTVYISKEILIPSRTIIKDSIIYEPIEVIKKEKYVPTIYKYSLYFSILIILLIGIYIFIKIKK